MSFTFKETSLEGIWVIEPDIFGDHRGHFLEAFRKVVFLEKGLIYDFVQDNISTSNKNTVRGLHYQKPPHAQAKLVMAIKGTILDTVVDLRKNSKTLGKHVTVELNDENRRMIYVPPGFAHGFSVLSDEATVFYKCNNYYHKASERGVYWDDPELNINWGVDDAIVSLKDRELPIFKDIPGEDFF